jgi:hypothetical protein
MASALRRSNAVSKSLLALLVLASLLLLSAWWATGTPDGPLGAAPALADDHEGEDEDEREGRRDDERRTRDGREDGRRDKSEQDEDEEEDEEDEEDESRDERSNDDKSEGEKKKEKSKDGSKKEGSKKEGSKEKPPSGTASPPELLGGPPPPLTPSVAPPPPGPLTPAGTGAPFDQRLADDRLAARQRRSLFGLTVVRIRGKVTGSGARITLLSVRAPSGARVTVGCTGSGCPVRRSSARAARRATVFPRFHRYLRAGVTLQVTVTKAGYVGRYTRFRIRGGVAPARVDGCLTAGSTRSAPCR